ncbi:hypothetical protein RYX36_021163 [Vicia faba]
MQLLYLLLTEFKKNLEADKKLIGGITALLCGTMDTKAVAKGDFEEINMQLQNFLIQQNFSWLDSLREIRANFKELDLLMEVGETATEIVLRGPTVAESATSFKLANS